MMRYQTVSPDCHPLSNGRKAILRACKEDDAAAAAADSNGGGSGRIANYNFPSSFEPKPLRARSASGSASITPENPNIPRLPSEPEHHQQTSTASQPHHDASGGGSVLPQWGNRKRPRGSRAPPDGSVGGRAVKVRRASAAYARGANLPPCTPVRDATSALVGRSEERSAGNPWSDKRSPLSPPEKVHKLPNGVDKTMHPEPEPTERETAAAAASRSGAALEKVNQDQFEWPRIYISLSRKEKEEDFLAMKGTKLPQRPKKRPKNVDKTLQYCFPGMWLSDLTRGRYEVREKKCVKKKRRGLKRMENMDSDSD